MVSEDVISKGIVVSIDFSGDDNNRKKKIGHHSVEEIKSLRVSGGIKKIEINVTRDKYFLFSSEILSVILFK